MRERVRAVFTRHKVGAGLLAAFAIAVTFLKVSDWTSRQSQSKARSWRLLSANVKDQPLAVHAAITQNSPDVVALQETGSWDSCVALARAVSYTCWSGADQCVLTAPRLCGSHVEWRSSWPGSRQPPQQIRLEGSLPLGVVNLHLAKPAILPDDEAAGEAAGRKAQYEWLRDNLSGGGATMVCGDFNDFPWMVDLGSSFSDSWRRAALGATFPSWLPTVRIDQCWTSGEVVVHDAWTIAIPSDHRGLMVEFTVERAAVGRSTILRPRMVVVASRGRRRRSVP